MGIISLVNYRAIIAEAWRLTQENKKLIWWFAFGPAVLSTFVTMGYLVYQVAAFWTSPFFNHRSEKEAFNILMERGYHLFQNSPGLTIIAIVIISIGAVAYLMLPVFTQGALIQIIARLRAGHPLSIFEGISLGFRRFLQLFEFHLLVKTFSFVSILSNAAFILRSLGPEAFAIFGWIFLFAFLVGLFLSLLFTYSEYYILIDDKSIFKSMMSSSSLVFRQWHHTLLVLILMGIISLRILINIVVALLIPILVVGPIFLFASITLAKVGLVVGVILGLIALYFASYFVGVFHVFSTAVWTFTFLELSSNKHDLNLREVENAGEQSENENEE